jgi:4-carboxymuconolactone decarboxylase
MFLPILSAYELRKKQMSMHEIGLVNIKEILGEEYFSNREKSTSSFNRDMRELTARYCFGDLWSRPGLDRRVRSMLVLAMLAALGEGAEIKMHAVGAINNGCTVDEIKEVLLQAAVYAGIPAGVEAFKYAEQALRECGALE